MGAAKRRRAVARAGRGAEKAPLPCAGGDGAEKGGGGAAFGRESRGAGCGDERRRGNCGRSSG
nr:MAG TPA: hypothetical protein [Caudoviricetes sp.]